MLESARVLIDGRKQCLQFKFRQQSPPKILHLASKSSSSTPLLCETTYFANSNDVWVTQGDQSTQHDSPGHEEVPALAKLCTRVTVTQRVPGISQYPLAESPTVLPRWLWSPRRGNLAPPDGVTPAPFLRFGGVCPNCDPSPP